MFKGGRKAKFFFAASRDSQQEQKQEEEKDQSQELFIDYVIIVFKSIVLFMDGDELKLIKERKREYDTR